METVSLSASFWMVPAVCEVLRKCKTVYTTNVDRRDEIREAVGQWSVQFIPFGSARMTEVLREHHPYARFLTFSDLMKIVHDSITSRDVETARILAGYYGWEIDGPVWSRRDGTASYSCIEGEQVPEKVFESMEVW